MQHSITELLMAACATVLVCTASLDAKAQSEASAVSAISAMPLASVVVGTSAAAGTLAVFPAALSASATVLVVKAVQVTANGSVYLLERASDGMQVSVEVLSNGVAAASVGVGTLATVSVIGAGTILSTAGEVLAFIPNALGRALLHNERVTL